MAFVQFENSKIADLALTVFNGLHIAGRSIRAEFKRPSEASLLIGTFTCMLKDHVWPCAQQAIRNHCPSIQLALFYSSTDPPPPFYGLKSFDFIGYG